MERKLTLVERVGWWIVDRLSYRLGLYGERQWEKQELETRRPASARTPW